MLAAEVTFATPLSLVFTTKLVPFTPVLIPNLFLAKTLGTIDDFDGVNPIERLGGVAEAGWGKQREGTAAGGRAELAAGLVFRTDYYNFYFSKFLRDPLVWFRPNFTHVTDYKGLVRDV